MDEPQNPVLSAKGDGTIISLDNLNEDVLCMICSSVNEIKEKAADDRKFEERPDLPGKYPPHSRQQKLSALKSFSMTNRHFRDLSTPLLFRSIQISGNWAKVSIALGVLEGCPAALAYARSFKFNIFVSNEKGAPPMSLESRLAGVLSRMTKLSEIYLTIPEFDTDKFGEVFEEGNLSMPSVRTLVLGSFNDFMIKHCPNVKTISTNGYHFTHSKQGRHDGEHRGHMTRLIEAAGKKEGLEYFEMNCWWRATELEAVYENLPNIEKLGMPGGQYHDKLNPSSKISELILTDASNLYVGFNPPDCGNAYMGPGGAELYKRVQEEGRQAEEIVAKMVFSACRRLERLWVGDRSRAEVVRNGTAGAVGKVRWVYETRYAPSGIM